MADSVYIHIPFCKQKCKYCSFVSFSDTENIQKYITELLSEIKDSYQDELLKTLYIGGGTPSLLSIRDVEKIVKQFKLLNNSEVTFEMNPDDAEINFLKELRNIGINRLSLGAQTFDNNVLKTIGRRHSSEQTINAIELAKKADFKNINLDLIYGLPNANIKRDLEIITNLEIPHISTYGLKIEEQSYFYKNKPENLPDDDAQADMYVYINNYLKNYGYSRYEFSNFSLKGYESKHNLNYWNNEEYYGFGIAAHGYINGFRYSNYCNMQDYLKNQKKVENKNLLTQNEKLEEEIFLGFRKESGIDIKKLKDKYNIDFEKNFKHILKKYQPEYIEKTEFGYKLTLKGILLSNIILSEFL